MRRPSCDQSEVSTNGTPKLVGSAISVVRPWTRSLMYSRIPVPRFKDVRGESRFKASAIRKTSSAARSLTEARSTIGAARSGDVPDLDRAIGAGGGEVTPIGREGDAGDVLVVGLERGQDLGAIERPDEDLSRPVAVGELHRVGTERHPGRPGAPLQDGLLVEGVPVLFVQSHGPVATGGGQEPAGQG